MDKKTQKSQSALREEEILKYWNENDIFNKSLEKKSKKGEYVFYEGPPTANGKPGIHHLEARAFKDIIPRYKTMCGYHVRRKGGWDTHGLPVELQVEKKLGLSSKKAIEDYGIAKFNQQCKESVWEYVDIWEKFTERIGYWVDQENPYVTYHNDYIESVWNVIKTANDKKLLYKDYKVIPWCPRCETALSSHELAQGYQDVKDLSVYVKFKVKNQENTYILAWTTTPWTLPGNVALAVGKDIEYTKFDGEDGNFYILASNRAHEVLGSNTPQSNVSAWVGKKTFKGLDLVDLEYEPLYPYLSNTISDSEKPKLEKAFKVYTADFVNIEDGTGIVHTAVMYGQDDFALGNEIGLPKHHLVGLDGKFLAGTGFLEGRNVHEVNENSKPTLAVDIIEDLKKRNLFFKQENYVHSYPHCWRCKTALIYYARDSWYIRMTELRDKMVKENEGINWEPAYIKEGRFGEWLRDIKDWAISRERYWGTPLPVWICNDCKKVEVIGSIEDLKSKTKKSGNKYFIMRHGEATNNVSDVISISYNNDNHLTEKGKQQVTESANELKNKKIDLIISSPFVRTMETSEVVASVIGLDKNGIIVDDRLHEMSVPMYEGKSWKEYHDNYPNTIEFFYKTFEGNESYNDMKKRTMSFIYDIEKKYKNKNILFITHGGPSWLAFAGNLGYGPQETLDMVKGKNFVYLKNGEVAPLNFTPIPHNENYELDLHKPYIDEVELTCDCGGKLVRTKEVMDVWLDSGTMPFSQDHYPFEGKEIAYPADFISEAIDQTRGWFYTLHAVGAIMGKGKAYKNVICLGLLLDANGKKMSKSLGNVVDPWVMMNKYGVDTIRLWMYSVNQPGESKNFDEKTVAELHSKVFNLLYNVLAFYELYRDKELEKEEYKESKNILDQWIITLLNKLTEDVTKNLDNYKLLEPVRAIRDFIDDLSTWYLRRSRERIKNGDKEAKETLYYVLKTLIKLMAPFTPFASEDIWQKLKTEKDEESVHLIEWPKGGNIDLKILEEMEAVREIVTLGLQARQKAGIPVRQPLNKIDLPDGFSSKYVNIIKEELNIRNVACHMKAETGIFNINLDYHVTEELKKEGQYRELLRAIQDIRKKNGLNPNDIVTLIIDTNVDGQEFINTFKTELMKAVGVKEIKIKENDGGEIKIDELIFKVIIEK